MQFGVAMLVCLFILCAARTIEAGLKLIDLSAGGVAALSLLLLAFNAVRLSPMQEVNMNAAVMLLLVFSLLWALRGGGWRCVLRAAGGAIPAAVVMLLIKLGAPDAPGACIGVASVLCMPLLRDARRGGFFMAALTPVILCAAQMVIDLARFGYAIFDLCAPAVLDAQVAGICTAGVYMAIAVYRKNGQKATPPDAPESSPGDYQGAAAP